MLELLVVCGIAAGAVLGMIIARTWFPKVEIKEVEVEIEKIKYVDKVRTINGPSKLVFVKNEDRKGELGSRQNYECADLMHRDGKVVRHFFTPNDLKVTRKRAYKNKNEKQPRRK